ncbi:MAG TPA: TetR/AcrR family transcriptional regulator [Candidatus Riflebacteria bacterium]|jgi:TetR/AcrR family transcriptional regulator|nr:TetR/AcrR family transcriptional regulator [Candidatus Riflebacteria bacterium]
MGNREEIINVATGLFADRGYDVVGIQEIVDQAGISKPTLYHYFGSKNGLLTAIMELNFRRLLFGLGPATVYAGDLPLSLTEIVRVYFKFARSFPEFYRLHLAFWFSPPASEGFLAAKEWWEKQQQLLEILFMLAANDHGNMKNRHRIYAATFLGTINTYIAIFLNGYADLNEEMVHSLMKQFCHGIYS